MNDPAQTMRLQAALAALEEAVANQSLLAALSQEEVTRLRRAAGEIYSPEVDVRRRLVKARIRNRKAAKIELEQSRLNQTAIRKLRREPVFTAPNLAAPRDFEQKDVEANPECLELLEPNHCYIC